MADDTASQSVEVAGTVDDCLEVILDFESYVDWEKVTRKSEVLERDDQGRGVLVSMIHWTPVKLVPFVLRYDYSKLPDTITFDLDHGEVDAFWGAFRFAPKDASTMVTYEMGVHPGFPIPNVVRRQIQKRHARGVVMHVKRMVEDGG